MQIFPKITRLKEEPTIKKGVNLPSDAINLGWYSTDEVNPKNFLSILDTSALIKENSSGTRARNDSYMMYADEFGVLRHATSNPELNQAKHSPIIKNSEVSISNIVINQENRLFQNYNLTNSDNFYNIKTAHSLYVSRFFTLISRICCDLFWNRNISASTGSGKI